MKKLLSLLTFLLCVASGAWAQTPALPATTLSLPDIPSTGWKGSVTPSYYHAEESFVYVFCPYELYQSVADLTWTTQNNGGNTSASPSAKDPFPASSVFTGFKAATLKGTDKGPYAYRVTNCIAAYAYVKSGSDKKRTITLAAYEVTAGEIASDPAKSVTTESNSDNVITIDELDSSKEYYIKISQVGTGSGGSSSGNSSFYMIAFEASHALAISTQPASASYVTGAVATALSITAVGGTPDYSYQWYKCDDALKTNPQTISGATSSSYTPSTTSAGTSYYYCKVTDSASPTPAEVESNVATITVEDAAAPTTVTITPSPGATVAKNVALTLTAAADGSPAPAFQWYSCTAADKTGAAEIDGATSATYSPSPASMGTFYFYVVATNASGSKASDVQTITVTGSNKCELTQVVYSNSFDAFIMQPTAEPAANGTVKAFYMAGTSAPTITSATVSDGATYDVVGSTLTVTAEDGVTQAVFDITLAPVTPFAGSSLTFSGTETWIKTGYGDGNSWKSGNGWRLSKNANDGRIPKGWNRLYLFLGPSESITLSNGGTARNIKVYRNGTLLDSPTSSGSCTIAGDDSNPYMIAIVANQTSGDTSFKTITVTSPDISSLTETIAAATGKTYATYVTANALDFSTVSTDVTAYIATSASGAGVVFSPVTKVPAGTPILVKMASAGGSADVPATTAATDDVSGNILKAGDGKTEIGGDGKYDYILSNGKFYHANAGKVAFGKAYLHFDSDPTAGAHELDIIFENGETTGIETIDHSALTIDHSIYDLQGRQVAQPTRGLYIVNGKKYIKY